MKRNLLLTGIQLVVTIGSIATVPHARAEANDSLLFNLVKSAGALVCLRDEARGRVSISDLGPVQNCTLKCSPFRQRRTSRSLSSRRRTHLSSLPGTRVT